MQITRLRFRIAEMLIAPLVIAIVDGLIHVAEDKPFMSEYLAGGICVIFLVRGIDVIRALQQRWPEID